MTNSGNSHTRRTSLALLLGSALLLTGCGVDEEPVPKFEAAPSATPTRVTEESAEEFIQRWNVEQTRMQTGDTATYRKMTPECEACQKAVTRVGRYYEAGGYVETKGRTILSIRPSDRSPSLKHVYLVEVDSAPTAYKTSDSAPTEKLKGGVSVYEVRLMKEAAAWRFIDYWQVPL